MKSPAKTATVPEILPMIRTCNPLCVSQEQNAAGDGLFQSMSGARVSASFPQQPDAGNGQKTGVFPERQSDASLLAGRAI
ncbi:MAG TPA: hypothetical protein VF410_01390 [Rhizomicrobium sp.]